MQDNTEHSQFILFRFYNNLSLSLSLSLSLYLSIYLSHK